MGHEFLRHVDRCRLLLHLVDVSGSEGRDPLADFDTINRELAASSPDLAKRPQIVIASKCDIATDEQIDTFRTAIEQKGYLFKAISSVTHRGTKDLPRFVYTELQKLPPPRLYEPNYTSPAVSAAPPRHFTVTKEADHVFSVDAQWLERILDNSDMDDYESLHHFQRQLDTGGVLKKLEELGVEEGDTIRIADYEFDYVF